MAATPYSLRYLANRIAIDNDRELGLNIPVQSNLEKYGFAMRYALNKVQYYSPRYNYLDVVSNTNKSIKDKLQALQGGNDTIIFTQ